MTKTWTDGARRSGGGAGGSRRGGAGVRGGNSGVGGPGGRGGGAGIGVGGTKICASAGVVLHASTAISAAKRLAHISPRTGPRAPRVTSRKRRRPGQTRSERYRGSRTSCSKRKQRLQGRRSLQSRSAAPART